MLLYNNYIFHLVYLYTFYIWTNQSAHIIFSYCIKRIIIGTGFVKVFRYTQEERKTITD